MKRDCGSTCPLGRAGQICVTRGIQPPVFTLPFGLRPGVRVRTLALDKGYWTVEEVDRPQQRWRVFVILLEVVQ
jgi:hypothetical protein